MGTDIHFEVETLDEHGNWKITNAPAHVERDPWLYEQLEEYKLKLKEPLSSEEQGWAKRSRDYYTEEISKGWQSPRNYCFFAALANVRNGYGVAGDITHEPIPSISIKRGLPEDIDISHTEDNEEAEWHYGDHNYGWATLGELLVYDWEKRFGKTGIVERDDYQRLIDTDWDHKKYPHLQHWMSSGVSGPAVAIQDEIGGLTEMEPDTTHMRVYFTETIGNMIGYYKGFIHDLTSLVDHTSKCRIVFGFDS
jgi:hypothetical protein